jgi:hypothetical protein
MRELLLEAIGNENEGLGKSNSVFGNATALERNKPSPDESIVFT